MDNNFDNTNHGVLFRNDRKAAGTKQPDFKGVLNVAGVEHQLAGWVREGKGGRKFFSLKLTPPGARPSASASQPMDDEDIPF